jgi:hypothetical protein
VLSINHATLFICYLSTSYLPAGFNLALRCTAEGRFCAPGVQTEREIGYNRLAAAGDVPGSGREKRKE